MVTCSACGAENLPGEMFCQRCGVQLSPVRISPPPPPQRDRPHKLNERSSGLPSRRKLHLTLRENDAQIPIPLRSGRIVLGRSDPVVDVFPDIDLTPFGADDRGVSRIHARIILDGENVYLEDLNSTNYTFLNDLQLEPGVRFPLSDGDEIRLGLFILEFHRSPE